MTLSKISPKAQSIICIVFAVFIFLFLAVLYFGEIKLLNFVGAKYTTSVSIVESIQFSDVLIGLTIYLKTAVDFAIVIGTLMAKYPGIKNRLAIETGTAIGNALGTTVVLGLWFFFKDIYWLLAIMILVASLVLLELAKGGLEHIEEVQHEEGNVPQFVLKSASFIDKYLSIAMKAVSPILSKILPSMKLDNTKTLSFWGLVGTSFAIPFILGLDDFAGYVPLFNIVNVLGFGIGVFLGHAILNVLLFINPKATIKIVKNPIISLIGTLFFIGLAFLGFYEVVKLLSGHH
jgi:hypothetical protein